MFEKLLATCSGRGGSGVLADHFTAHMVHSGSAIWDVPLGTQFELTGKADIAILPKGTHLASAATDMRVS
jgi:hypothetical protein